MRRKLLTLALLVFLLAGASAQEERQQEPTLFEKVMAAFRSLLNGSPLSLEEAGQSIRQQSFEEYRQTLLKGCPPWPDENNRIEFGVTAALPKGVEGQEHDGLTASRCLVEKEVPKLGGTPMRDWFPLQAREIVVRDAATQEPVYLPQGTLKARFTRADGQKEPDQLEVHADFGRYFENGGQVPRVLDVTLKAEHAGQFALAPDIRLRINVNEPGMVLAAKTIEATAKEVAFKKGWALVVVADPRVLPKGVEIKLSQKNWLYRAPGNEYEVHWSEVNGSRQLAELYVAANMPDGGSNGWIASLHKDEVIYYYSGRGPAFLLKLLNLDVGDGTVTISLVDLGHAPGFIDQEIEHIKKIQAELKKTYGGQQAKPKYLLILGNYYDVPLVDNSRKLFKFEKPGDREPVLLDSTFFGNMDEDPAAELAVGRLPFSGEKDIAAYFGRAQKKAGGAFNAVLVEDRETTEGGGFTASEYFRKYLLVGAHPLIARDLSSNPVAKENEITVLVNPSGRQMDTDAINEALANAQFFDIQAHGFPAQFPQGHDVQQCRDYGLKDIPPLPYRPVVSAFSCSTAQLLGPEFIRQGAAAYLGFPYPSGSGYEVTPVTYDGTPTTVGEAYKAIFNLETLWPSYGTGFILLGDPSAELPQLKNNQAESFKLTATEKQVSITLPKLDLRSIFRGYGFSKSEVDGIRAGKGAFLDLGFNNQVFGCSSICVKDVSLTKWGAHMEFIFIESPNAEDHGPMYFEALQEKIATATRGRKGILLPAWSIFDIELDAVDGALYFTTPPATYELPPVAPAVLKRIRGIHDRSKLKIRVGDQVVEHKIFGEGRIVKLERSQWGDQPVFAFDVGDVLTLIRAGALDHETTLTYEFD